MDERKARLKARALIEQAMDTGVGEQEARTFAMNAVRLIARWQLLDESPIPGAIGSVVSPEVGEVLGDVMDLVGRAQRSGVFESIKRVVGSSRRAGARAGAVIKERRSASERSASERSATGRRQRG